MDGNATSYSKYLSKNRVLERCAETQVCSLLCHCSTPCLVLKFTQIHNCLYTRVGVKFDNNRKEKLFYNAKKKGGRAGSGSGGGCIKGASE